MKKIKECGIYDIVKIIEHPEYLNQLTAVIGTPDIKVTARQLTELYEKHDGILVLHQYKDLKEMVLVDSSVRDAKWALREFDDETLLGTWNKEIRYGYGKRPLDCKRRFDLFRAENRGGNFS